jgi:hypothetical protein
MKTIAEHVVQRNPVWVMPLALPLVIFGSESPERALLFVMVVGIGLPVIHMVSFYVEGRLPRMLRIVPVVIVAAAVFSVLEMLFLPPVSQESQRLVLMVRGAAVSGIVIVPTIRSRPGERFSERIQHVLGLTIGFILGFALFTVLRLGLVVLVGQAVSPVAAGFFLLALGRIGWNAVHAERGAH